MSEERARGILASAHPLRAVRYERDGILAGYALEIVDDGLAHYWYSSYTPDYAGSSVGMWLMLDAVRRAQKETRTYIYLGTAYGSKGRYKTNFTPLEWWDGSVWNTDLKILKERVSGC